MPEDSSSHPGFNYQHPVYLRARDEAFARSGGLCQLCGQQDAEHGHHWAEKYPPADKTTGAFPISRSRAHTHRRHGHPLQTVPSAGLIERPQEKNRVDALR